MKRIVTIVSLVVLLSILFWSFGCAKPAPSPSPSPAPQWPKKLTLTTLFPGSTVTVYGTGIAAIIEKYLKIPTAPENTSSTVEATMLVFQGKSQLATSNAPNCGFAMRNTAPWPADSSKILRAITFAYETHNHWTVRADSAINTFEDLKGKRVMCKREGEASFEDVWRATLEAYGLSEKTVTIMPELGLGNQTTALKEGRADCIMHYGTAPVPGIVELATTTPVRVISHNAAKLDAVFKKLPWINWPYTIPAGTYKGQDKDALVLAHALGIIIRKDVPDDLVYAIVKAIDEHIADLNAVHPAFKKWTIKDLANNPFAPYHAGAYKYYMEKGYLTPQSIEQNKAMLAVIGERS